MSSKQLIRLVSFLLLMTLGACLNPVGPRLPEDDDKEKDDPNTGDTQSMVFLDQDIRWV